MFVVICCDSLACECHFLLATHSSWKTSTLYPSFPLLVPICPLFAQRSSLTAILQVLAGSGTPVTSKHGASFQLSLGEETHPLRSFQGTVGAWDDVSMKCYEDLEAGPINSVGVWESAPRGGSIWAASLEGWVRWRQEESGNRHSLQREMSFGVDL